MTAADWSVLMASPARPRPRGSSAKCGGGWLSPRTAGILITGGPGTGVDLLDLVPLADLRADPLRVACARVGTSLARETWAFYAPDVPYRDACADG